MSLFSGIEWAPLQLPLERRLQTLAALFWLCTFWILGCGTPFFFLYIIIFTNYYYVPLLYLIWMIYDWKTPHQGGRRSDWVRNWTLWKYFVDYFPAKTIKTATLDPNKNYIFGCHPHGVLSTGHFVSFGSEATGFSKLYPGITPYLLSLNMIFFMPVYRDFFLTGGMCAVSKDSIASILGGTARGNAACIIIGGAAESLTDSTTPSLVLKNRKGFIKQALKYGACLVPVYGFGENFIYNRVNPPKDSWTRMFQDIIRKITGVAPVLFRGRGIFQYSVGLLPFRRPLTVVVGAAIDVPQTENPSEEIINKYHQIYIEELFKLYEKHKHQYSTDPSQLLQFI